MKREKNRSFFSKVVLRVIEITRNILKYDVKSDDIRGLVESTGRIEEYLIPEKIQAYGLETRDIVYLIQASGNIETYLTPEKIQAYGLKTKDIVYLIQASGNIEAYLTPEKIQIYGLKREDIIHLIENTGQIDNYIIPEKIYTYGLNSNDIIYLIKATGNIEAYLTPEKILAYGFNNDDIRMLIQATGKEEKYIFEGQDCDYFDASIANVIKATGRVEEYLIPERMIVFFSKHAIKNDPIHYYNDITNLIRATGQVEKYLFEWQDAKKSNLILDMSNIIKGTGRIEEYLIPEEIEKYGLNVFQIGNLIKETNQVEKYLFEWQDVNDSNLKLSIANVIKATGRIEEYLTPEIILRYYLEGALNYNDITDLIKATGEIEKYLFEGQDANNPNLKLSITNLIKATGQIEEYLTPEKIIEYRLNSNDITNLIKETGQVEKYLFKWQDANDSNLKLSIANIIKATGRIEEYLIPDTMKNLYSKYYWWHKNKEFYAEDITNLIRATGQVEKYLFEWQDVNDPNLKLGMANLIKATGNIEEYLTKEKVDEYGACFYKKGEIVDLIKELGKIEEYLSCDNITKFNLSCFDVLQALNPELEESDLEGLDVREINFKELWNILIKLDPKKIKDALYILDRLDKSNSAELRRVKIEVALQILEKSPEKYNEALAKIEEIYLNDNIPTVGKVFLVFKELHPHFLGEESRIEKDNSSANIPSLMVIPQTERKYIIFSDLLECALESNDRNLRAYLEIIEQGNFLYEQLLNGELKLEELNETDEKLEILSKYRDILNTLYNLTSKGKRKENYRKNNGNLENDLKELDSLFGEDLTGISLPDRLIRIFAYGTNIKTFEQIKNIIEKTREKAHNRNVQEAKSGKIELKKGDFIKGIESTQYFPTMLQRGILAKDFLGGDATYDGTPLDTDVEKVLVQGENFNDTLKKLKIAPFYTDDSIEGNKLGTIMLVFSGEDFIETRDSSKKVNKENIELLRKNSDKKEVFNNFKSAYGIRTGVASSKIKCIIADRYIDKLGLEIAKNGFYIPVVDREGNVIFTEKMYNDFREKMQGLVYYGENKFIVDDTARNEGTRQIVELVDKIKKNSQEKKEKILKTLEEAINQCGYKLSGKRKGELNSGEIEIIEIGSTGRGTNEPGDGDFDFLVRIDKKLSDETKKIKEALKKVLNKIRPLQKMEVTQNGDYRCKGVFIEGIEKEVDIDFTFLERNNEIYYSTDECIKERLDTIKKQSREDYRYVVANILLAKKILKQEKVYKKSNAPQPEVENVDSRGGLGAVGIENWVLQNGGSFYKAAESFLEAANSSKDFEEFISKYSVWDFGENYISVRNKSYPHDNFVSNMSPEGYERMKNALRRYIEEVKKEDLKKKGKIGIADIVEQDTSIINDTLYMRAVKSILAKQKELER